MTPEAQRLIVEAAIDYVEAEVQWRRVGGPRQLQIRREAFATLRSYVEDRDHIDEMDERMDGLAASSPATAGRDVEMHETPNFPGFAHVAGSEPEICMACRIEAETS